MPCPSQSSLPHTSTNFQTTSYVLTFTLRPSPHRRLTSASSLHQKTEKVRFEPWQEDWLSWLSSYMIYLSPSSQVPRLWLRWSTGLFLYNPSNSLFIIILQFNDRLSELLTSSLIKSTASKNIHVHLHSIFPWKYLLFYFRIFLKVSRHLTFLWFYTNKTGNVRITQQCGGSRNYCCSRKTVSYLSVCVCVCVCVVCVCVCAPSRVGACTCSARVALLIQHATRMYHIALSFVVSLSPPHLSTLPHKRHDFREKVTEHEMCFDFLNNVYLKHLAF
jgi:hypothetical protein